MFKPGDLVVRKLKERDAIWVEWTSRRNVDGDKPLTVLNLSEDGNSIRFKELSMVFDTVNFEFYYTDNSEVGLIKQLGYAKHYV